MTLFQWTENLENNCYISKWQLSRRMQVEGYWSVQWTQPESRGPWGPGALLSDCNPGLGI